MKPQPMEIIREPFTPHHLLELAKVIRDINNKNFTNSVAEAMHLINNPPMIMELRMNEP